MFSIQWDLSALIFSVAVTFFVNYYITSLLHRRYDCQFGWSFIVSGLVAFSLPLLTLIGIPTYLISAVLPVHWGVKAACLLALLVPLLLALMLLKAKILSKIFPAHTQPALSGETR